MNVYFINLSDQIKKTAPPQRRKALSNLLVKKLLAKEMDMPEQKIQFARTSFGKPYLINNMRHFNVSFSNETFMMVTNNTPVGADIEYIKEINDIDDVISNFAPEEQKALSGLQYTEKIEYFYRLWVLKESYIKAIGKGFSCPLNSFYIADKPPDCSLIYSAEKDLNWIFKSYSLPEGYKSAVCARTGAFFKKPITLYVNDLLNA